ncbi:carboxypeptidase regulatory-like domain-containing protein [Acidicapsa acidisoli]|uniref:carboxypeptidase regulatory-like domain-containing protein n=1 Tax=Acidicapsa acidisoli TaxID=1615681 RepID=UPI0021E062D1|nr:carboxypeptidase regulatory-like domain-containing protein [Acidicapsa acidisoli]
MQRTDATQVETKSSAILAREILNETGRNGTAWAAWIAITLLLLLAPMAQAQYRASIQGVVSDSTGAVIPGAKLTLTDIGTKETQVRTSNADGIFNFNALPPDTFTLVVEKDGFQKKVLDQLVLIPEQANAVNVALEVGGAAQTVTVNASTESAIDTETANNGASISENEVQHMPTYERDVTSLIQLAPGVLADGSQSAGGGGFQSPGTQTGASSGGGGNLGHSSSIFATENGASASANGGQFETNGYTVDGISTVSAVWGGATIVTPSEDSVSNVKIVTNAYDAENGRFSGALTEITSKSGTNDLHGSFFVQVNRPGLNAYQRWNGPQSVDAYNASGQKLTPAARGLLRDEDRYNQLGGSIGGPIWKNKIFAFFNYEGQSQTVPQTSTQWFPTSQLVGLAPANSIASTYLNFKGAAVLGTVIASANCADANLTEGVNCRTIAGQGLNIGSPLTTALGTQDLTYVSASTPGVGSGLSNIPDIAQYSISNPTSSDFKQYNGRLDADVTQKDHASFAIYWVPASTTTYNGGLGYQLFNHDQVNDAFSVIWNHIFSPTFLNEARANAAGWRYNELASNPQAPFGLPQDQITAIGSITLGNLGVSAPAHYDQWTYGYKDVATKVLRTQTMKFGFDLTRLYYLNDPIGAPNYTFYNIWDFLNDAPEAEGGPFQAKTGIPGGYRNDNRETLYGIFFQDDWKARPNLTLSAGLRYNYFGPLTDKDNNMGVLSFGSGSDLLTGINIRTGINAWQAQKLNFGPQVGFNWSPTASHGRIVFRGGYGLNYNQQQIATANNYDGNPPGTSSVPGSSKNPAEINPNILYAVSSSPTDIFGFPPNPSAITTFNSAGLPTVGNANLGGLPGTMPTEYSHHYSVDMEIDLTHSWVANLGYEGSSSHHTLYNYDANALGDILGAPLNPLVNSVNTFGSQGKSNNNMMLAGLKHQFSHTFSAEAQYTWAHSMDTDSGPYFRDPYLYNPKYSYGRSDFDINSAFKLFGVWEPVIFHGSNNWAEKFAGGWSLSGILTLHTGYGWTPVYQEPHQIYCNTCNYGYQNLRPTYLGGGGVSTGNNAFKTGSNFTNPGTAITGTNNDQFNNNYFSVPNYSAAITDTAGQATTNFIPPPGIDRNSFSGPGYRNVDITAAKAFGLPNIRVLGEHAQVEIKANIFNLFNFLNINPSSLSTNIANSGLGQAHSALGSRTIDFQARFSF